MIERDDRRRCTATDEDNKFLEVTYAEGRARDLLLQGLLVRRHDREHRAPRQEEGREAVIERRRAGHPARATSIEAVREEFKENEDLPNTTNPDDWARISGKKGERIVYIRTVLHRDGFPATEGGRVIRAGRDRPVPVVRTDPTGGAGRLRMTAPATGAALLLAVLVAGVMTVFVASVRTPEAGALPPVSPRTAYGSMDSATVGPGVITVSGWARDPDTRASIDVVVAVDRVLGAAAGVAATARHRTGRPLRVLGLGARRCRSAHDVCRRAQRRTRGPVPPPGLQGVHDRQRRADRLARFAAGRGRHHAGRRGMGPRPRDAVPHTGQRQYQRAAVRSHGGDAAPGGSRAALPGPGPAPRLRRPLFRGARTQHHLPADPEHRRRQRSVAGMSRRRRGAGAAVRQPRFHMGRRELAHGVGVGGRPRFADPVERAYQPVARGRDRRRGDPGRAGRRISPRRRRGSRHRPETRLERHDPGPSPRRSHRLHDHRQRRARPRRTHRVPNARRPRPPPPPPPRHRGAGSRRSAPRRLVVRRRQHGADDRPGARRRGDDRHPGVAPAVPTWAPPTPASGRTGASASRSRGSLPACTRCARPPSTRAEVAAPA